jgi:hypothetical protein
VPIPWEKSKFNVTACEGAAIVMIVKSRRHGIVRSTNKYGPCFDLINSSP